MFTYAQIVEGVVVQIISADSIPIDGTLWIDITTITPIPAVDWTYNGTTSFSPPISSLFAQIVNGVVTQIIIAFAIPTDTTLWIDITAVSPAPAVHWTYDGATGTFIPPPMFIYAQIVDGVVSQIATLFGPPTADTWIDITTVSPAPAVNWTYDGTSFMPPISHRYAQILNTVVIQIATAFVMPLDGTWIDITAVEPSPAVTWTYTEAGFAPPQARLYAQITLGIVTQINHGFVAPNDGNWLEITAVSPVPQLTWNYDGTRFTPPVLFNYARIVNGMVAQIISAVGVPGDGADWVDITAVTPHPMVNWLYDGSNFTAPVIVVNLPPTPDQAIVGSAMVALGASDSTIVRCFESGITIPPNWLAYRQALRKIVANGTGTLPDVPALPTGLL